MLILRRFESDKKIICKCKIQGYSSHSRKQCFKRLTDNLIFTSLKKNYTTFFFKKAVIMLLRFHLCYAKKKILFSGCYPVADRG